MMTVRQLERLWQAKEYGRLMDLFMETRLEASLRLRKELGRAVAAAAMAVIRLDELNQAYTPFCGEMLRVVLGGQEEDGGWGDPLTTAICLRALMCSNGDGPAIERGLGYLANIQKSEGIWPRIPMRRMPADAFVSAFILFELGEDSRFARKVRVDEAWAWFEKHPSGQLDVETARLWRSVAGRRGRSGERAMVESWS